MEFNRRIGDPEQVPPNPASDQIFSGRQDQPTTTMLENDINSDTFELEPQEPKEHEIVRVDCIVQALHWRKSLFAQCSEYRGQLGPVARMNREIQIAGKVLGKPFPCVQHAVTHSILVERLEKCAQEILPIMTGWHQTP